MSITPDTKDWTWVLTRECPDCGFNAGSVQLADIGAVARQYLPHWQDVLTRDSVRQRPAPTTWSELEYGAHVRDVFTVMTDRLELMLTQDNPGFADWDQDEAAVAGKYSEEDPAEVLTQFERNLDRFARAYDQVTPDQQERKGLRSNGSQFTVLTLGQYALHDIAHHSWDTTAGDAR